MAEVTVDPKIFERDPVPGYEHWPEWDGWDINPRFLVQAEDRDAAARALYAAGQRFCQVGEDGEDVGFWELERDTPSWVSDVYLTKDGPVILMDTDGSLPRPMGEAMIRILVSELLAAGVTAHISYPDSFPDGCPTFSPPADGVERPRGARAWYVVRQVRALTTTGKEYDDMEFRCADGSWVRERSQACTYQDPPKDLLKELRAKLDGSGGESINGLLLSENEEEDWPPLPPKEIRAPFLGSS